jgi:hypothetical protein
LNTGKIYEKTISSFYDELNRIRPADLKIERDVVLIGRSGVGHQIDILFRYTILGVENLILVECKDHNKNITKSHILDFHAKIEDINNASGFVIASKGYQSGAVDFAKYNGIKIVSANELDLVVTITKNYVEAVLPKESDYAEPFYTVMDSSPNRTTGTYSLLQHEENQYFMLFLSKKYATNFMSNSGQAVYPVTGRHLAIMGEFSKAQKKDFAVFFLDDTHPPFIMRGDMLKKLYGKIT